MSPALTRAKLKALVKLYRSDVEGAAEQLQALMNERWDELSPLLGIAQEDVARLLSQEDLALAFARAVEQSPANSRWSRAAAARECARVAAVALGKASLALDDGAHRLPANCLREVLDLWRGDGELAFEGRGSVDIRRLRALLRHCAALDSVTVTLTSDQLVLDYSTVRARGVIRLRLRDHGAHDEILVVPMPIRSLETTGSRTTPSAVYTPATWPADDAQHAASPQHPMPPARPVLVLVR